ncbi:MAG: PP2C family protein-serine/threonine phosphatase [Christensenellales bacterium]|jgi:sigma-B regulation protein RsbU (phosphoserine phosphatase)
MKQVKLSLGKKLTALVILMGVVLGVAAVLVSYRTFEEEMTKYYNKTGTSLARTLATQLDPEDLDRYFETAETDEKYFDVQDYILDLVEANDVEYLYVVRPNGVGATFLFDSDMTAGEDGNYYAGGYCSIGTYVDLEGVFAERLPQFLAGEEMEPIIQHDEAFGWLMTAMYPVLHEDGSMAAYVMADIDMNDVVKTRQDFLMGLSVLLVGLTVVLLIVFLVFLRQTVVRPIDQLTTATGAFIENNKEELAAGTAHVNVPDIRTGDEVQQLAMAFRKMQEDMLTYIRDLMTMTAEKERIGAELNVATQIQADMLPRIFPPFPERGEFDIYAIMNPAKEVGGDFYDFFLVDDDHLAVVIADVSGKGVPAALFMVIAKTLIKNHAQNKESPASVFTNTNSQLCEGNDAGLFVTSWMAVLTISTGELSYVNAGHNPPLLKRKNGQYEWLKSRPGFVLAGMEGVRYKEGSITLEDGDRLFLYTDGVTEATDLNKELFGEERLQNALNEKGDAPIRDVLLHVREQIDVFVGEAEQFDDITMLGIEYTPTKGRIING